MNAYIEALDRRIPDADALKLVQTEAAAYAKAHASRECFETGLALYARERFQLQEVGVLLLGYAAHEQPDALVFLKETVSRHPSWKVQELLAMAFDVHCKTIGYEAALPLIREWLGSECANTRRAVSEGLRIWTSRPYFREHPEAAIRLLADHRADESEYVRKSVGNALKDIGKKHPALLAEELQSWDTSSREVRQVYRLASKWVEGMIK